MLETSEQTNVAALVQLLAELRFDKELIRQFFGESVMRESVIYQEIYQEGRQEGEREFLLRLLVREFEAIAPPLQDQICSLSLNQLESLGEALLDFSEVADLIAWLEATRNPE